MADEVIHKGLWPYSGMGQYKVPQNVEAEDKIIGPLTFKQFIYACIGVVYGGICFALFRTLIPVMIVIGLPPTLLFLLLGFYTRDGQNFEQLLTAMVGFFANPRRRLWIKDEVIESFHVVPHVVVAEPTQRNSTEVRSELDRLATMIDARGWNESNEPFDTQSVLSPPTSDRIVEPAAAPSPTSTTQPTASEDILDLQNSPLAKNLGDMLQEAAKDARTQAVEQMMTRTPTPTPVIQQSVSGMTNPASNGIIRLATERDDLTVSQLAATATRMAPPSTVQSVELQSNGQGQTNQ